MKLLSVDPGLKKLGYVLCEYKDGESDLKILEMRQMDVIGIDVKSMKMVDRCRHFRSVIKSVEEKHPDIEIVLIEHQMTKNFYTQCIQSWLLYHFCEKKVRLINARTRQKLCLGEGLDFKTFETKHKSQYTARKNHSYENAVRWLASKNISVSGLKKKELRDICDALLQIIVFLRMSKEQQDMEDLGEKASAKKTTESTITCEILGVE